MYAGVYAKLAIDQVFCVFGVDMGLKLEEKVENSGRIINVS